MVNEWGGQPLPLSATCFHDGILYIRLSGAAPAAQARPCATAANPSSYAASGYSLSAMQ